MKKEEEEGVGKKVDIASLFKHAFSGWYERRKGGKTFFSTFYAPAEPWGGSPGKSRFRSTVFQSPSSGGPYLRCVYVCTVVVVGAADPSIGRRH